MSRGQNQKVKLLKLMELLKQETDEQHPMTTNEICDKLKCQGIPCDRRILSADIEMLNDFGFEIMNKRVRYQKAYYVEDRGFSTAELKIIIDAIQASAFVTEKKTKELTEKVSKLAGTYRGELLARNQICYNTRKHSNESIYYIVDFLEEALLEHKKVSFLYFDLNEKKERVYRKDKQRYIVDPVSLICNEDNYYLMTFSDKYHDTTNYRIDRMEQLNIENEPVCDGAIIIADSISDYTKQVFKMYDGNAIEVELQFDYTILGAVFDKFGENIEPELCDGMLITKVVVQISPTFWGWLFQFGKKMKIISPPELIVESRKKCLELLQIYRSDKQGGLPYGINRKKR